MFLKIISNDKNQHISFKKDHSLVSSFLEKIWSDHIKPLQDYSSYPEVWKFINEKGPTMFLGGAKPKKEIKPFIPEHHVKHEKIIFTTAHQIIKRLRDMHMQEVPTGIQEFLYAFKKGSSLTNENFIKGINHFTTFANLNLESREREFGNRYLGLHYSQDLTKEWNNQIKDFQLSSLCHSPWEFIFEEAFMAFVYKGNKPAEALDSFVTGPSVIDCGMFTQLSLWFGIRYMLGNELFNQLFGSTPLYITQLNWNNIADPSLPYSGNPLFPFFRKSTGTPDQVSLCHLKNNDLYQIKHPGGSSAGHNSIKLGTKYTIFKPSSKHTVNSSKEAIQEILATAFNEKPDSNDATKLEMYKKMRPNERHQKLGYSFQELVTMAYHLQNKTIKKSECGEEVMKYGFDLSKFKAWIKTMTRPLLKDVTYEPTPDPTPSDELLTNIPIENRHNMTFAYFEANIKNTQQAELMAISKKFCADVMNQESTQVVLTGNAGVGKTASAVCCAKELESNGKNIVWISEVMIKKMDDSS